MSKWNDTLRTLRLMANLCDHTDRPDGTVCSKCDVFTEAADVMQQMLYVSTDLAQALLEMRCDCPNYGVCTCFRQQAIDAWTGAVR